MQLFIAVVAAALWSWIILSGGYAAFRRNKVMSDEDYTTAEQHVIESK